MSDDNHGRDEDGRDDGGCSDNDDDRPKYAQVRDALVERVRSGVWKQGQLIPSEPDIAAEFGVSTGTARRALESLVKDHVLIRRHGAGTWVQGDTLDDRYRFFGIFGKDDVRITPDSRDVKAMIARANSRERSTLSLEEKARVIRISRTRIRNGRPFIVEKLSVPEALFPSLTNQPELPDALYDHYQKAHKVLVMAVRDQLYAVAADTPTAETLRVKVGAPLLKIDRVAYAPDKRPVEWRVSLCHLKDAHFLARVGG
jgi:GntR family transcriptional regulator